MGTGILGGKGLLPNGARILRGHVKQVRSYKEITKTKLQIAIFHLSAMSRNRTAFCGIGMTNPYRIIFYTLKAA